MRISFQFIDPENSRAVEVDHAYMSATGRPTRPVPDAHDLGLEREGLAFIAGYVASRFQHIQPALGCMTKEATEAHLASVPSRWLQTISRGSLQMPHSWWMAVVEQFEEDFGSIMGPTFSKQSGIVSHLTSVIINRHPTLDARVARRLAKTRLYVRIGWLRDCMQRRGDPRAAKQMHQHITSQK